MIKIQQACEFMNRQCPRRLAEDWDNVGLLVGDRLREIDKIMTCLTITPATAAEAVSEGAGLIVTHHPMPFRAMKRLTTDNTPGRLLLQIIEAGIAVYSPHTAFDSAVNGINQQLAEGIGLGEIEPLVAPEDPNQEDGTGRRGRYSSPISMGEVSDRLKSFLNVDQLRGVGSPDKPITKVAIGCGSAGQFIDDAKRTGCDLLLTGETNFHTCLEAEACDIGLLLPGHFASERFAVEQLAKEIATEFTDCHVWASKDERNPFSIF